MEANQRKHKALEVNNHIHIHNHNNHNSNNNDIRVVVVVVMLTQAGFYVEMGLILKWRPISANTRHLRSTTTSTTTTT